MTLSISCAFLLFACGEAHVVSPTPPTWLDARADEAARVASAHKAAQRASETNLHGVAYEEDGLRDWTVNLDDKHCYWFGGIGDTSVVKFSLYLWDPSDHRVTSKRSDTSSAVIDYCPSKAGPHRLQGKVAEGYGHFAVAIYAADGLPKPAPAPAPAAAPPPATLEALIEQQAASAAPGATRTGTFFEGTADKTDWFAVLEPGHCYWFIGAGERDHVKKLSLYLWDPRNKRLTETFGDSNTAMVGHCASERGMFKFQAKVESGSGRYKVGVYDKKN